MKHLLPLILFFFGIIVPFSNVFAQNQAHEKCYSGILHQQMMSSNPDYVSKMQQFEQYVQSINNSFAPKTQARYVIPVVFHVIHLGEAVGTGSNVSEAAIKQALRVANERYRNLNNGGGVDTQIEFALAVRDPQGNCTNGITRMDYSSNSAYASNGVRMQTSSGITDAALKALVSWNRQKYYNIYVVTEIDNNNGGAGVQGYAMMASAHGAASDGSVFMASNILQDFDQTLIHELGHALNLYHTFEGDGNGASCPPAGANAGDMCGDTPPHKRSQSDCNATGTNSCNGGTSNSLFVHNYMDYSSASCVTQFTANQATRMQAACSGVRNSFFTNNTALTPVSAPTAAISIPQQIFCSGAVKLFDNSSCVANTFTEHSEFTGVTHNWTVTNGSVNLTSTTQNPTFNITQAGWYDVTLAVTNAVGTNSTTITNAFYFSGASVSGCSPRFSNAGNYAMNASEVVFNTINSFSSSVESGTYDDFICSKNTIVNAGDSYELKVKVNAYGSTNYLKVYIDWDNNGTFTVAEKVLEGNVAGNQSGQTSGYKTATITIPATAVKNQILKMRVITDQVNPTEAKANCTANIMVGDVEDYGILVKDNCPMATFPTQPTATSICPNANGSITATVGGATNYQWQVSSDNGATWTDVANGTNYANVTTQTLSLNAVPATFNNYQYRVKATNACGDATSTAAILTVSSTIDYTTQPVSETVCANASLSLGAVATGASSYIWQVSTDAGTSWTDLSDGGIYSGATTATLNVTTIPVANDGYQYRVKSSSTCVADVLSDVATITVTASSAQITQQPLDAPSCPGATTSFEVVGTGINSYQWQVSTDGGTTWTNMVNGGTVADATTNHLTMSSVAATQDGNMYRCVLTTDCGTINTTAGTLSVNAGGAVTISAQPQDKGVCPGNSTTMNVLAVGASTYQWQFSTDNGTTWNNVTNGTNYTGSTTNTLNITGLTAANSGIKFRCEMTSPCGNVTTNVANLTISDNAVISTQPTDETLCEAETHTFRVVATQATNYQWQISYDGSAWMDLNNSTTYTGVATANLEVSNAQYTINNSRYRCQITGGCGSAINSDVVFLTVVKRPEVYFGNPQIACIYDSPYTINEVTPSGGTFSGTGISNNLFNPATAGIGNHEITYTVVENGCSKTVTASIEVGQCLETNSISLDNLKVYPNPASEEVTIEGDLSEFTEAILVDNQGRIIANWNLNQTSKLDVSQIGNGAYHLKLIGTTNSVVTKIQIIK